MSIRPVHPDDLFKLKILQGGSLSPDGKKVVYVVSHIEKQGEEEKEVFALWLMSLDTKETRQLTNGRSVDNNPRWSPDGKGIAFVSARGGAPQIYLLPMRGGEARQLTNMKQGVGGGPLWSPDGKRIAFTAGPAFDTPPDPGKPYRWKRKVYRFDGMGNLDTVVQNIYVIDVDGGEPQQLTDDGYMNAPLSWSPDGSEILYSASMSPDTARYQPGLRAVDLEGRKRDIVWEWGDASVGTYTPDGKRIVFVGTPDEAMIGTNSALFVIDVKGEAGGAKPENRTPDLGVSVGGGLQPDMPALGALSTQLRISPGSDSAYIQVQDGGTVQLYRIALKGKISCEALVAGDRSCLLMDANAKNLLYAVSTWHDPMQLYISDIEGGNEQALTSLNEELLSEWKQPVVHNIRYPGKNGVEVEGWLMEATVGQAPYPTILYIHGGPWGAFGNIFSFDFQMLAGAGYAVAFINYRGSSGYGDEFGTALQANWGDLDYHDQMLGLDYLIGKGLVDGDRLGVTGVSAGGFGSCWMVGQTDRFKAAVPENPVTNMMSLYGVSDIGSMMIKFMNGKPHEAMENYVRCSPITYAHRCKTPVLLIQGELDHRCPPEQSEQFYSILKDNGCTVEMLRLPNSPHVGSIAGPLPVRKAQNAALLDWMNRYVLGKAPDPNVI